VTITLVCGPPCAGKTTYVEQHAQPDDLVVDLDHLAQLLGSPRSHGHPRPIRHRAEAWLLELCDEVAAGMHPSAWIVRTLPDPAQRAEWAAWLNAQVVVLDAPDDVLIDRAQQRPWPGATIDAIRWWRQTSGTVST